MIVHRHHTYKIHRSTKTILVGVFFFWFELKFSCVFGIVFFITITYNGCLIPASPAFRSSTIPPAASHLSALLTKLSKNRRGGKKKEKNLRRRRRRNQKHEEKLDKNMQV